MCLEGEWCEYRQLLFLGLKLVLPVKHPFPILNRYLQMPAVHCLVTSKSKVIIFISTLFCPSFCIPCLSDGAVVHWITQKESKSLLTLLFPLPMSLICHQVFSLSPSQQPRLAVPMEAPSCPLYLGCCCHQIYPHFCHQNHHLQSLSHPFFHS